MRVGKTSRPLSLAGWVGRAGVETLRTALKMVRLIILGLHWGCAPLAHLSRLTLARFDQLTALFD